MTRDQAFGRIIGTLEAGRVATRQKHNDTRFITVGILHTTSRRR